MSSTIEEYRHESLMLESVEFAYTHLAESTPQEIREWLLALSYYSPEVRDMLIDRVMSRSTSQYVIKLLDDCDRYNLDFDELVEYMNEFSND